MTNLTFATHAVAVCWCYQLENGEREQHITQQTTCIIDLRKGDAICDRSYKAVYNEAIYYKPLFVTNYFIKLLRLLLHGLMA